MMMLPRQRRIAAWKNRFISQFVKRPGEHLIVVGITGSGKTQLLYWLADLIAHENPDETIVWFDIGKNDEAFKLGEVTGREMRVIVPAGCRIVAENYDFELVECDMTRFIQDGVWNYIHPDKVNIISFYRFIFDPTTYTKVIADIFRTLILKAHSYELPTPMALFFDEFHNVAPSRHNEVGGYAQYKIGGWIQLNVEKLRSLGVRLIASTHSLNKIRSGIKSCFNWIVVKRIAEEADREIKKLKKFSPMLQTLRTDQCVIFFPDKSFTDKATTQFYGETNGRVYYYGVFEGGKDV